MSGYEEQLHARAEMLGETGELAAAVTAILAFASGAGVDPCAMVSLRAVAAALDPAGGAPAYQAGSRAGRHPGSGYRSDSEFLEAVSDAEDQIRDWLPSTTNCSPVIPPPRPARIDGSATLTTTASRVIMKKPSTAAASVKPELEPLCMPWLARRPLAAMSVDIKSAFRVVLSAPIWRGRPPRNPRRHISRKPAIGAVREILLLGVLPGPPCRRRVCLTSLPWPA